MPQNPYIAGNPISDGRSFFGREDIFGDVMDMLRHPESNAIVLYGQRRVGKTSVLMQLEQRLDAESEYVPVYADLQDKANLSLAELLFELALRIAAKTGSPFPDKSDFDSDGRYFREEFLAGVVKAAQKRIVLLFDEFDVLDSDNAQAASSFFPTLRGWMASSAHVKLVFVIGRRPEDLSNQTLSLFKQTRASRISLLPLEFAERIIRQSEQNGTVHWTDDAVRRVWEWTRGHAYLTQLLCSNVWEGLWSRRSGATNKTRTAGIDQIEAAVPGALEQGANAFHWIWTGLPPAAMIVTSAMAGAPDDEFTQDTVMELLNKSGVRIIVRELESAPTILKEWELLQSNGNTFRFAVPLLRRWIADNKPLNRVREELDRLVPEADLRFQIALQQYNRRDLSEAENSLQQSLRINPNHLRARLLIAQIMMELDRAVDAIPILEEAYKYDPGVAGAHLINALLASANQQTPLEQNGIYERVLLIDPHQATALDRRRAYLFEELALAEGREQWSEAIAICDRLMQDEPDNSDLKARLFNARARVTVEQQYTEAVGALETGDRERARKLLSSVIGQYPDYKDATRHLLRAVLGMDTDSLEKQLRSRDKSVNKLKKQLESRDNSITEFKKELDKRHEFISELKNQLSSRDASIKDLKRQIAKLGKQVSSKGKRIDDLKKQRADHEVTINDLKKQLGSSHADINALKDRLEKEKRIRRYL